MSTRRRAALAEMDTNVPMTVQSPLSDVKENIATTKPKIIKAGVTKKSAKAENNELKAALHQRDEENESLKAQIATLTEELANSKIETESKPTPVAPVANPFGGAFPPSYVTKSAGPPPARPSPPFHFFAAEFREKVKESFPSANVGAVNAELRKMWNERSEEEKEPFIVRANEELVRYEQEKADYEAKREEVERTNRAVKAWHDDVKMEAALKFYEEEMAKKSEKDSATTTKSGVLQLDKPKQPRSAWNFYVMQRRAEQQSAAGPQPTLKEMNTELSESWNKLQRSKKKADKHLLQSINEQAAADRKRYEEEMAAYNARVTEMRRKADQEFVEMEKIALQHFAEKESQEEILREGKKAQAEKQKAVKLEKQLARQQKKAEKEAKAAMPKAPRSAYIFFVMQNRSNVQAECPGLKPTAIMGELGARWKAISEGDKEKYTQLAADDRVRYEKEKEAMSTNK